MRIKILLIFVFCQFISVAQRSELNNNKPQLVTEQGQNRTLIYDKAFEKIAAYEAEEREKETARLREIYKANCARNNVLYLADLEKLNNLLQYDEITDFEQFKFHFLEFYGNSISFPKTDTAYGFDAYNIFCLPDTFSIYNFPNLKDALYTDRIIENHVSAVQIERMPADVSQNNKETAAALGDLIYRILAALDQKYPDKSFDYNSFKTKEAESNFATLDETINYRTRLITKLSELL